MLSLGTAQFGFDYGVSNETGKVGIQAVEEILCFMRDNSISHIDTAHSYGDCESILGKLGINDFKVTSKMPDVSSYPYNKLSNWTEKIFFESLNRLGLDKIDTVLVHSETFLLNDGGKIVWDKLNYLKNNGYIEKIGYSIYSPENLDFVVSKYKPDVVQTPFNVLDQRIINSGWLRRLKKMGVQVEARSIFLQGLLLMPKEKRPSYFSDWEVYLRKVEQEARSSGLSNLEFCLGAVASLEIFERIVVGVTSLSQIQEIFQSIDVSNSIKFKHLANNDARLIDPFRWNIE